MKKKEKMKKNIKNYIYIKLNKRYFLIIYSMGDNK